MIPRRLKQQWRHHFASFSSPSTVGTISSRIKPAWTAALPRWEEGCSSAVEHWLSLSREGRDWGFIIITIRLYAHTCSLVHSVYIPYSVNTRTTWSDISIFFVVFIGSGMGVGGGGWEHVPPQNLQQQECCLGVCDWPMKRQCGLVKSTLATKRALNKRTSLCLV